MPWRQAYDDLKNSRRTRVAAMVILSVASAWVLALLTRREPHSISAPLFTLAVVLSAGYGGTIAGLAATLLSVLAAWQMTGEALDGAIWVRFISFVAAAVVVGKLQSVSTRARVKAALESEERLRRILDSLFTFVGVGSPEGLVLEANRAALEGAGLQTSDVLGKHFADTYWFAWSPMVQEQIRKGIQSAATGPPARLLVQVRIRPDAYRTVDMNIVPMFDSRSKVASLVVSAVDITERLATGAQLRETESRFRATFEQAAVGLAHLNFSGRFIRVNQKLCDILGYSRAELLLKTFSDITYPADLQESMEQAEELRQGKIDSYSREKLYRHAQGHGVWAQLTVSAVRDGSLSAQNDEASKDPAVDQNPGGYFIAVIEDITQRKKVEQTLRDQENHLHLAMEAAQMGTCEVDFATQMVQRSGNTDRLFGLEPNTEELLPLAKLFDRVLPEDLEKTKEAVRRSLRDQTPYDVAFRVRKNPRDGAPAVLWLASRGEAVRDYSGKPIRLLGAVLDISARKKVEEELQLAKQEAEAANVAKDQFLAVLSHELRTPLNPVLATVSYLDRHPELPEMFRQDLELVHRNVELEARLIDDLLDLTRISRGKLELNVTLLNATSLVNHTLEIVRNEMLEKHLNIKVTANAPRASIRGDHARLQQVFWNLLKNAVKFTPEYGTIEVTCTNDAHAQWILEVKDTGVGILPEHLGRIFDAFEQADRSITRRFGGLGLGLAISKTLVDLHHGKIEALSGGRNKGSLFRVTLPTLDIPTAPSSHFTSPTPLHETAGLRVLLIEDHPDTLQVMQRLLTIIGCKSAPAKTAAEARQLAAHQTFDLVLSDVGLPDGSGHDLMLELRAKYHLKGIALSGFGMDSDVKKSRDCGFAEHLTKPIQFEQLRSAIERVGGQPVG